jgi:hypothetical protein
MVTDYIRRVDRPHSSSGVEQCVWFDRSPAPQSPHAQEYPHSSISSDNEPRLYTAPVKREAQSSDDHTVSLHFSMYV